MPRIQYTAPPTAASNGHPAGSRVPPELLAPRKEDATFRRLYAALGLELNDGCPEAVAECPFCGGNKLYVNVTTGQYDCKSGSCLENGNHWTFIRRLHERVLEQTTDDHYRQLKDKRGIALQTLKRHSLAYDPDGQRWLIPFRNAKGDVANLQLYYPDGRKPNKLNLPGLPICLYGLDKLSDDKSKILFLCEGPFDAIALDQNIGSNNRPKYDILAIPGALKEEWVELFRGRKVRALFDNDAGGPPTRRPSTEASGRKPGRR